jgi:dihydrofolate synthase/folylpolyglutamate synthase
LSSRRRLREDNGGRSATSAPRSAFTAPQSLTYHQVVRELFPRLTGGIRWGLERVQGVLATADNPETQFASIHVGGTNGKGSVSATLDSVLRHAGLRTGLYTSPHLCSFRERIQLDGRPIEEAELLAAAVPLWPALQESQASFFEATTALAFHALARARVQIGVIEVGLGGRLDATNVIMPMATVLTNVAMDHAEYLGSTLGEVATEKAGIIKPGIPVITAEPDPTLRSIFAARAAEAGAPFHTLDETELEHVVSDRSGTQFTLQTRLWGTLALRTPLVGHHQAVNAALSVRALELLPERFRPDRAAVIAGVERVRWPGRMQFEERADGLWLFDVAHNTAGVNALVRAAAGLQLPRPVVLVAGILADKDWRSMLPPLFDFVNEVVLTVPPSAPAVRRWDPHVVLSVLGGRARIAEDFPRALQTARELAREGTVLVTGSFHTVGDALALLGIAPFGLAPDVVEQQQVLALAQE